MKYETRRARARKEALKRLGIWVFLVFFALSVAGAILVVAR